jgi:hypothetical protein
VGAESLLCGEGPRGGIRDGDCGGSPPRRWARANPFSGHRRGAGNGRRRLLSVSKTLVTVVGTVRQYTSRLPGVTIPTDVVCRIRRCEGT